MDPVKTPVITTQAPDLPYTLIRIVEVEAFPGSDRITAIARADVRIFSDGSILPSPPQQLIVDPMEPQRRGVAPSCTPLVLCQAVWTAEPPAIVCTHGARSWELIEPAVVGRLARVDTAKLSLIVWPGLASHALDHVCGIVTANAADRPGMAGLTPLQLRLVQVQMLLAQLYARGARLLDLQPICHPPDREWISSCMADQAGDPILQAAVDLSTLSTPPVHDPRPFWDQPDVWIRLASEELDYVLGDPSTTPEARAAAIAEYQRREAVKKAASIGHTLTRRPALRPQDTNPTA